MTAEMSAPTALRALQRRDQVALIDHPVITRLHDGWCSGVVSPRTHWVLGEHRVAGLPALPGTGGLETVRCAFEAVHPPPDPYRVVELTDVAFVAPLSVAEDTNAEIQVRFTPSDVGSDFELIVLTGDEVALQARGSAAWARSPRPAAVDVAGLRDRCTYGTLDDADRLFASASGVLTFGPHWRNLREIHSGPEAQLARLVATPEVAGELGRYVLHPALLDEAVGFVCAPGDDAYLPLGYGRITVRGRLPDRLWSHARARDLVGGEILAVDLWLYDDAGDEVVAVSDLVVRRVDTRAVGDAARRPETRRIRPRPGRLSAVHTA